MTMFLCFVFLIGGILAVYLLRRKRVHWFPEAWVFVLIGTLLRCLTPTVCWFCCCLDPRPVPLLT